MALPAPSAAPWLAAAVGSADPDAEARSGLLGSGELALSFAALPPHQVLRTLDATLRGLVEAEADRRALGHHALHRAADVGGRFGSALSAAMRDTRVRRLGAAVRSPFVLLLAVLALISAVTGNAAASAVIGVAIAAACVLRVRQESRGERAVAALRAATGAEAVVVRRAGAGSAPVARTVPLDDLVPGDIVRLAPGDVVPADLYLLRAADLTVAEGALTGESRHAAKSSAPAEGLTAHHGALDAAGSAPWLCRMGTLVASGTGTGVVLATGSGTAFGATRQEVSSVGPATDFDRTAGRLVRCLSLGTAGAALLAVALLATDHGWRMSDLVFAVAVAAGLTPEMLPVVSTGVLVGAARSLARRGTALRQLSVVHNLGAMQILCLDKTGTLTEGRIAVDGGLDPLGRPDPEPVRWAAAVGAALAERAPGLLDLVGEALLEAAGAAAATAESDVLGVLPFDPVRRRSSALLREPGRLGTARLVSVGAPDEVIESCDRELRAGQARPLAEARRADLLALVRDKAIGDDVRLLAVAVAELPGRARAAVPGSRPLRPGDEHGLALAGFVVLRDRFRPSVRPALDELARLGIEVRVLTGDGPAVAAAVGAQLGLLGDPAARGGSAEGADGLVTGAQIAACDPAGLPALIARGRVFAQVTPLQKAQVVRELRRAGCVTGFLGDGVNDAAALRAADASVSLRSAAPLARECSDAVLGADDLAALAPAVVASRRAVANAAKYLKITISADAGNTLSMLLAALALPFLPMLPLQVLVQNLGFDLCQLALAGDRAGPAATAAPRGLALRELAWFTAVFGLLGTAADLAAFGALGIAHAAPSAQAAFQAGWFAENLLTQALAIRLLRADRATRAGRGSAAVAVGAVLLALTGLLLPRLGPAAAALGFAAPAAAFYPWLALIAAGYCALAVSAKAVFRRRLGLAS